MRCQLAAVAGTLPLWAAFHQRLHEEEEPQAARRAAFLAAPRRDD